MLSTLVRYWWVVLLRGLFALAFGVMALVWPGITVAVLVLLFGAYSLADGIFAFIAAVQPANRHGALILEGLAGVAAGVIAFLWPGLTAIALLFLIAAWSLVTGVLEIIAAVRLRKQVKGEIFLTLSGIAGIVFGVLLMTWPATGILAVVWLIGAYALIFGALLVALAFRLRAHKKPSAASPGQSTTEPYRSAV
jgi:uncharacterized membrane protein HdeD (DUF308 family)